MGVKDLACKQYMRSDEKVVRDLIRLTMPDLEVGELKELNPERLSQNLRDIMFCDII